ncbi:MAG: XdhC family protein [Cyclobacteriaceae bacterium]
MFEYLETLNAWKAADHKVAMARVIKAKGSSPRPMGSMMFVNSAGQMMGSVSGGCVEGEMVKNASKIFEGIKSMKLGFGVADEDAWAVGLPCGGAIHTFLQQFDITNPVWAGLAQNLKSNTPCALITSLEDDGCKNTLINKSTGEMTGDQIEMQQEVDKAFKERSHKVVEKDGVSYFIQIFPRKPLLLAIGAAHITADLVAFGNDFGFETVVIDPRGFFSANTVFKSPPSRIITDYPSEVLADFPLDNYTYCAILSHDPKIDDDAIDYLLKSEVAYIGALGSKQRHVRRRQKLIEKGFTQSQVDRIHGPIGVSINSVTAKEIALSIVSEIIQVQNQYVRNNIKAVR